MASRLAEGTMVDYTPGSAVTAGAVVVLGGLVGVPANDIGASRLGALAIDGLFTFPKSSGAIAVGADVFWVATGDPVGGTAGTGAATATGGAVYLGKAALAAADTATTVQVILGRIANMLHPSNVITDPGNAGAIPVTASGSVQLVTTAAQTRTLAAPTFVGQVLVLSMKTDGGDCVVTASAGVNQTGNNTLTFNDAGDTLVLVAIESGSNKRWRIVSNDGVTLTTV